MAKPPTEWNVPEGDGVRWKVPIPGLGHSSPVVWGSRVFVTTAISSRKEAEFSHRAHPMLTAEDMSPHEWRLYAVDREEGKILWQRTLYEGVPRTKRSPKNSFATETPVTDGRHVVVHLGSHGLYCFNMEGELLWKKDLGVLDAGFFSDPGFSWGTASSPILHEDRVIIQADVQDDSFLAAFDVETGEELWRTARDEIPGWSTPTVVEVHSQIELVTNGAHAIRSYDPENGKLLWELETDNSVLPIPTPVMAQEMIIVGNGYRPLKPLYAIHPGGRGDISLADGATSNEWVAWSKKSGGPFYVTPIIVGDHLYVLSENGVLTSYYLFTGEQIYRQRVGGRGTAFSASPVSAAGKLFLASEDGTVYVIGEGLEYQVLATNPVGEGILATPALVGDMIILRTRHHLVGLGSS